MHIVGESRLISTDIIVLFSNCIISHTFYKNYNIFNVLYVKSPHESYYKSHIINQIAINFMEYNTIEGINLNQNYPFIVNRYF